MDLDFRTTEDLNPPQQLLASEMAEALWEAMQAAGKQRIMTCIAVERMIAAEIMESALTRRQRGCEWRRCPQTNDRGWLWRISCCRRF